MKRITFAVATALILGALTIALPKLKSEVKANPIAIPAAPQFGDGTCKNVKFRFKNGRENSELIEAKKIEYQLSGLSGWRNEVVSFTNSKGECPNGLTCVTTPQNLGRADGRVVTKVRLLYWYKGSKSTDNWSDVYTSREFVPESQTNCYESRTYPSADGQWTIFSQK